MNGANLTDADRKSVVSANGLVSDTVLTAFASLLNRRMASAVGAQRSVVAIDTQIGQMADFGDDAAVAAMVQAAMRDRFGGNHPHPHQQALTIIVPVNVNGNHWVLAVVHNDMQVVRVFDSMRSKRGDASAAVTVRHVMHAAFPHAATWPVQFAEIPQQRNGYDCGVWVLMYMDAIVVRDVPVFVPDDPKTPVPTLHGRNLRSTRRALWQHIKKMATQLFAVHVQGAG